MILKAVGEINFKRHSDYNGSTLYIHLYKGKYFKSSFYGFDTISEIIEEIDRKTTVYNSLKHCIDDTMKIAKRLGFNIKNMYTLISY